MRRLNKLQLIEENKKQLDMQSKEREARKLKG